jgi:cell division septation protein DedD
MTSITLRDAAEPAPVVEKAIEEGGEFEIVLGKRQIAGVLFLASVFAALFSGVSYMAGEAMGPRRTVVVERPAPVAKPAPAPTPAPAPAPAPAPVAAAPEPKPAIAAAPLFADPEKGVLYLQMGAVEKGIAVILAEGLRTHGFQAFVAPGPSEKIFRVLIGPIADHDAYSRTKSAIDDLGLSTFARKYQQESPASTDTSSK